MKQQLEYFQGVINSFFGQFSMAFQAIAALIKHIKLCKQSFKARERTNKEFCCKFMYAIDIHYQLWLKECMTATRRDRVNDLILDFCSPIEQIQFETFDLKLPSKISAPKESNEIKHHNDDNKFPEKLNEGNKLPGVNTKWSRIHTVSTSHCKKFKPEKDKTWQKDFTSK